MIDEVPFFDGSGSDLPTWTADLNFDPWQAEAPTTGLNLADQSDWSEQTTPFTCAIVSQQMILRDFGIDLSEAQLTYDATANGWLSDGGTSMLNMGALLEHYGVETHYGQGGGVESLIEELAQGHRVIAAVDSGELWGEDPPFADWLDPAGADHALVIKGLDTSNPDNIQVIVNDPGDPAGGGKPYPLSQFVDAWTDSGQSYVSTTEAPTDLANDLFLGSNFNADSQWYFTQDFWADIVKGLGLAATASISTETVTGDDVIGTVVGIGIAAISSFSTIMEHMPEDAKDDLFASI